MAERKWSHGITLKHGGLGGWNHEDEPGTRHRQLNEIARKESSNHDGGHRAWETIRKRLQILSNLTRHSNPELSRSAQADARWVERIKE